MSTATSLVFQDASNGAPGALQAFYVAYQLTNNSGSTVADPWVTLTISGGSVVLAENDNKYHLKDPATGANAPLANGQTKPAFFLVKTTAAGVLQVDYPSGCGVSTLTVTLYAGDPDTGGVPVPGGAAAFPLTCVIETLATTGNTIHTIVTLPNPIVPGALASVTVTGNTGSVGTGATDLLSVMSFTPAGLVGWPADAYELVKTSITLPGYAGSPYINQLLIPKGDVTASGGADVAYTAVYTFVVNAIVFSAVQISPVAYITHGGGEAYRHYHYCGNYDAIPHTNGDAHQHAHADREANGHGHAYGYVNRHADADPDAVCLAHGDPHAGARSGSWKGSWAAWGRRMRLRALQIDQPTHRCDDQRHRVQSQ